MARGFFKPLEISPGLANAFGFSNSKPCANAFNIPMRAHYHFPVTQVQSPASLLREKLACHKVESPSATSFNTVNHRIALDFRDLHGTLIRQIILKSGGRRTFGISKTRVIKFIAYSQQPFLGIVIWRSRPNIIVIAVAAISRSPVN